VPGPGASLFEDVHRALGGLPFVAEDLGVITPDVSILRDAFHFPGTRVLQFAFDEDPDNPHLPDNHNHNTVVYTGTHDNATTRGWYEDLPVPGRRQLWRVAGRPEGTGRDAAAALLDLAWSSVAALAVAPVQDVLNLGTDARMNQPGTARGNWRWRAPANLLAAPALESLRALTRACSRSAGVQPVSARRPSNEQPAAADRSA
jgi:4-alpha-glucanotransferase